MIKRIIAAILLSCIVVSAAVEYKEPSIVVVDGQILIDGSWIEVN